MASRSPRSVPMPRAPRLHVPGGLYHVVLRGNHQQAVFDREADYHAFEHILARALRRYDARVHAYCWMTNHIHMLIQVGETPLGRLILRIAGRYARTVQRRLKTTGHLFEKRYYPVLVDADAYLLGLLRYIHLNPVRARMVEHPRDYPWSSHGHYAGLRVDSLLTPHPLVWALGNTPFAREAAYAELVRAGINLEQQDGLTRSALSGWVLGDEGFIAELQKRTDRRLTRNQPGRPVRVKPEDQKDL